MKKKNVSITVLVILSVFLLAVGTSAASKWDSTAQCNAQLRFSGDTAECALYVETYSSTDNIKATVTLKKETTGGYVTLRTWSNLTSTGTLEWDDVYSPCYSGTYHLVVNVEVNGVGGKDTIRIDKAVVKN